MWSKIEQFIDGMQAGAHRMNHFTVHSSQLISRTVEDNRTHLIYVFFRSTVSNYIRQKIRKECFEHNRFEQSSTGHCFSKCQTSSSLRFFFFICSGGGYQSHLVLFFPSIIIIHSLALAWTTTIFPTFILWKRALPSVNFSWKKSFDQIG